RRAGNASGGLHQTRGPAMTSDAVLTIKGLGKRYGGQRRLLQANEPGVWATRDIDIDVKRGSTLGIVGESGSGKTTLARMVAGLTRPTTGTVLLGDKDTRSMAPRTLHQRIQ